MKIHIEGTLDYRQQKQHLPYTFTMPEGATRLSIQFGYSPKVSAGQDFRNDLSLSLFDPQQARGARHNNQDRNLTITAQHATPGYLPGALQPGVWTVWIDTHRVLPPDTITYTFDIDISTEPITEAEHHYAKVIPSPRGRGWYRGDLHGHTLHSDGSWDVPDLIQYARDYQLDFVTLSDHNTTSGHAQFHSLGGDDLLTIGGMELTTYYGHALALGIRDWVEWRVGVNGATMPELAQRVMDAGGTYIIAHPMSEGDPFCTGCDWAYPDMMPGNARCVEVWNSEWSTGQQNEDGLLLWYRWLNERYRIVATRGTDIHRPIDYDNVGFNVVYAEELSESAILAAIRKGHSYISAYPRLDFTAQGDDGSTGMMGDLVAGEAVRAKISWEGCNGSERLRVIVNGDITEELSITERGQHEWTLGSPARWCVVEIRRADGEIVALTNPIFLGKAADWR